LAVYVIWPWINGTLIPWLMTILRGVLVFDLYSIAWVLLIVLVLVLLGRR
jgi:hypothetical protein